jgi:hypothetical protein
MYKYIYLKQFQKYFNICLKVLHDIEVYAKIIEFQMHHRSKRGFWEGLEFQLSTPSVDWRKKVGTKALGASFGVIMENYLDLKIGRHNTWCRQLELQSFPESSFAPMMHLNVYFCTIRIDNARTVGWMSVHKNMKIQDCGMPFISS